MEESGLRHLTLRPLRLDTDRSPVIRLGSSLLIHSSVKCLPSQDFPYTRNAGRPLSASVKADLLPPESERSPHALMKAEGSSLSARVTVDKGSSKKRDMMLEGSTRCL